MGFEPQRHKERKGLRRVFRVLYTTRSVLLFRWIAAWEEGVRHNLGGLSPRGVVVGPEVWEVVGWHARFAGAAAWIARHNAARCQALDEVVEGVGLRHILEGLVGVWLR